MVTPFDQVSGVITRVQREIVLARFLGKVAVDQGLAELRSRIEAAVFPVGPGESQAPATGSDEAAVPAPVAAASEHRDRPDASPVGSDELALADYDSLPASDIVATLAGLEPDELEAIERYELAHRGRRTVLGRIRQLQAP